MACLAIAKVSHFVNEIPVAGGLASREQELVPVVSVFVNVTAFAQGVTAKVNKFVNVSSPIRMCRYALKQLGRV